MGRLHQEPLRRAQAGTALPISLYPPRRHLRSSSALYRRQPRRLPLEGLSHRWTTQRWKTMTLHSHEFIRRFLTHVLPNGFHRIRHYGLFASANRTTNIARVRELLGAAPPVVEHEEDKPAAPDEPRVLPRPCPQCGGRMIVIEVFERGCQPTYRPTSAPMPRHLMIATRITRRKATRRPRRSSPSGDPRSSCRPSPMLQGKHQAIFRPSFRPSKQPRVPSHRSAQPFPPPKIHDRYCPHRG